MQRFLNYLVLWLASAVIAQPVLADTLKNALKDNPSPYLAMHGHDPVHWQLWNEQTVERARRENKLLYVSVGYFSCHWCHVMQRESYQNKEIAKVLNDNFIPVKVDRELNPALDTYLIEFVQRTRGTSGWPLNVFITPEGHPLIGIVYLPPVEFKSLIENLRDQWKQDAVSLKEMAASASSVMQPEAVKSDPDIKSGIGSTYEAALIKNAMMFADDSSGGFGNQSKFPQAPQLRALLAAYEHTGNKQLKEFLVLTLDNMASQGVHDLVGGGFFRYAVDPLWRIPHFEKMLYDNALLADLYLDAARVFNQPRYEKLARSTLDFMLRDLGTKEGALAASLSAVDDKSIEGGDYLFSNKTLKKLLTKDELKVVKLAWDIDGVPSLEAGHLPVEALSAKETARHLKMDTKKVSAMLASARKKLFKERTGRHAPLDDKKLGAWNGLALIALAHASSGTDGGKYLNAARKIRDYLANSLWDGNKLIRARSQQGALGNATLADYAYVAAGLWSFAEVTNKAADFDLAGKVVKQGWKRFYGTHGWKLSEKMLIAADISEAMVADSPLPSPSGVLIDTTLKLAAHNKDEKLKKQALSALNTGHDTLLSEPFWFATHVAVIADYQRK